MKTTSTPLASAATVTLLWLSGCGAPDTGSATESSTSDGGDAGDAGGLTGGDGTEDGADGDGGGSTGGGGDGADSGSETTGGTGCEPPGDSGGGTPMLDCRDLPGSCGDCIWEKCCELSDICTVNADCACMTMCISTQNVGGTQGCLEMCGLTGLPPGFSDLLSCAASACSNAGGMGGECSVPAGFEPPPEAEPPPPGSGEGIGSGTLADCGFGSPGPGALQLQSEDGSVCVRIERRDDGPGSLANTSWALLEMQVGPLGEVVLIDEPSSLCWYSSHHNFNDWAHAWSGNRYYEVKAAYAGHSTTQTFELHVSEQPPVAPESCAPRSDGVCPIATMELFPVP